MSKLLLICLAASLAAAQPKLEVYGRVLESGTNHPIEGAEVKVWDVSTYNPFEKPDKRPFVITNAQGEYRYAPPAVGSGFFLVEVKKENYSKAANDATTKEARLSAEASSKRVDFAMAPLTDLTGRFVDAETDQPIAGLTIWLTEPRSDNGVVSALSSGGEHKSDAEGRLTMKVAPGSYSVMIPRPSPAVRLLKTFSREEAEATDLGYGYRFLPGGPSLDTALPITITAGGLTDFGTLRLKKQPLYRVRVSTSGCAPGETLYLQDNFEAGTLETSHSLGEVPCGPEFLLKNMQAGRYVIQARNRKYDMDAEANSGPGIKSAVVAFDVGEGNRNLTLTLASGITVEGRVFAQGATPAPLENLKVSAWGTMRIGFAGNNAPRRVPDKDGRFRWENMSLGPWRLTVDGLGQDFYIKQVRVRGVPIRGLVFNMPESGSLEVEIDSNPATLSGSVLKGDKPVANASVAVVSWPLVEGGDYIDDPSLVERFMTDAEGRFQAAGLVPGEYRAFAVTKEDEKRSQLPGVWSRIVANGERLILSRGAASTIDLKLTDPGR